VIRAWSRPFDRGGESTRKWEISHPAKREVRMGSLTSISHIFEACFPALIPRNSLVRLGLRRVTGCLPTLRYVGSRVGTFHGKWTRVGTTQP
jgi:hypothetical protein